MRAVRNDQLKMPYYCGARERPLGMYRLPFMAPFFRRLKCC